MRDNDLTEFEVALELAVIAHRGQRDKAGEPYILHPLRVAVTFREDDLRAVAMLHDVVEDTRWTLDELRVAGFSEQIVDAVDALTHRKNESTEEYYARICANEWARRVKAADIADNTDPMRMVELDENTRRRLVSKYRRAMDLLERENPRA